MSNIKVQGNVSGTGTLTFAAPNTNSNRTLTLPDETGTVLSSVSDLTTQTKAALNASNGAPIYACRAWVNFNGTGTIAIRASGNVSSITDNGTGDYTVNFATAMQDANYCTSCSASWDETAVYSTPLGPSSSYPATAAQIRLRCQASQSLGALDPVYGNAAIFR